MKKALYPGTFDPITYGHLDLIDRATKIFDHLIVTVLPNPDKTPLLTANERIELIQETTQNYPQVEVDTFDGLLVDYARNTEIHTVVRGLRALTEFEHELATAVANRRLDREFESVYLMPSLEYIYLSSTMVREVAQFGGDLIPFVPRCVEQKLRARFPVKSLS